jgi:Fic family protein
MNPEPERHSKPLEVELITDPDEKARQEARNGLRQFDEVIELTEYWLQPDHPFRLRPSAILGLHRTALEGLSAFAGVWRPAGIEIEGSKHRPPGAHLVPQLIEEMCDYVNDNWSKSPIHLSAYVMWRMNWIHPFVDGNGRTARALSYLVLCVRLASRLPGTKTIPEQIAANKDPYYEALEAADGAQVVGNTDVAQMEGLISALLANQLVSVLQAAKGGSESLAKQS